MDFKKCNNCGNTILATNQKCPFCGSDNFSEIVEINHERNNDSNLTTTGGSIWLGVFLGLFLGAFGFLIACISINKKENGLTIKGVAYGVIIQCLIVLVVTIAICI